MEYRLLKNEDGGLQLTKDGVAVKMTDILTLHPDHRVYALRGPMGAGKTTFTKALCEELGTMDVVNSPTFAIVNVYDTPNEGEIYHFDCYRLKTIQEALDFGAEEYLYSGNYCFIEWPEMIEDLLPEDTIDVIITPQEDGTRMLRLE